MQYTQLSRRSALVKSSDIDWEKQYLTFIPVEDAIFTWAERATSGHLEYSLNGGQTWVTIANGESTPTITAGSKVIWRGDLKPNIPNNEGIGTFSSKANYHAKGNTMSLLYSDDFYGKQLDISGFGHEFQRLFYNNTHILSAPLLPATILSAYCYSEMFSGCTSLISAPELPATKLTVYCYRQMFQNCTRINYIKCLATDISALNSHINWLKGVSATGIFVKDAAMEDWPIGASGIPEGWTVIDE